MRWRRKDRQVAEGPPASFDAEPGARGVLELRADIDGHGLVGHRGEFRYVGPVRGLHAFVPAHAVPVVYLHADEVIAFEEGAR